jgi:hypothetical protein
MNEIKKEIVDIKKDVQKVQDSQDGIILITKEHNVQMNKALDIAKNSTKTANTTVNILNYARNYLNDAKPLEKLTRNDVLNAIRYNNPKGNETENESYVKTAVHKFNHGNFAKFIGDMIIDYYRPNTKSDANLIATDTSRLSFIIMQKIKKNKIEQKEWINDKSGKKFTELVLRPIINAVKETLVEFLAFKKKRDFENYDVLLMEIITKCVEIKRDIEVDKFITPILKHVAPDFHFDSLKILDEDTSEIKLNQILSK